MRKRLAVWVMALTPALGGCSTFQAIEQWKCDNWGCCMFGTRPSCECAPCCDPCGGGMAQPGMGPVMVAPGQQIMNRPLFVGDPMFAP